MPKPARSASEYRGDNTRVGASPTAGSCDSSGAACTIDGVSTDRQLLAASDLDAMSPDERAAALAERVVTDLDVLPDEFRQRVLDTGSRLAAERRSSPE